MLTLYTTAPLPLTWDLTRGGGVDREGKAGTPPSTSLLRLGFSAKSDGAGESASQGEDWERGMRAVCALPYVVMRA